MLKATPYDILALNNRAVWFAQKEQVSFLWKNPDFLSRNPDFLSRNPDFRLKNVNSIIYNSTTRL